MTRSTRVAHAVTALRAARAADSTRSHAASMTFMVFEDNGGGYHWTIIVNGETLVRSASFASYEKAEQAARVVHGGASSASFEERAAGIPPIAIGASRDRPPAQDRLNESRSFGSRAVTKWPASR